MDATTRASQDKFYGHLDDSEQAFLSRLDSLPQNARVLEIGCGDRPLSARLAARGISVVASDRSEAAVAAASIAEPDMEVRVLDAEDMPFAASSFDAVIGVGVLHDLDTAAAYAEVSRVLRADGVAHFLEPLGHNPLINAYRRRTPGARSRYGHPLRRGDVLLASRWFGEVECDPFHLLAIATAPVAGVPGGAQLHKSVARLDRSLVGRFPRLAWQAWIGFISLREPVCD